MNVDKLSTFPALIGLLDFHFEHVTLTRILNRVGVKLLRDAKSCQELCFVNTAAVKQWYGEVIKQDNTSHSLAANVVCVCETGTHGTREQFLFIWT